jgi:hypothetical protein
VDTKEYYEGYKEWVVEELWDGLGREPNEYEIDQACTAEGFANYLQDLAEAYHERLYC